MKNVQRMGRLSLEVIAPPLIAFLILLVGMIKLSVYDAQNVSILLGVVPIVAVGLPAAYIALVIPSAIYAAIMELAYHYGLKERSWSAVGCSATVCALSFIALAIPGMITAPEHALVGGTIIASVGMLTGAAVAMFSFPFHVKSA